MLLVIDVGNTDAVFGFFEGENLLHQVRILSKTNESDVFFEYRLKMSMLEKGLSTAAVNRILISSVVPSLTGVIKTMVGHVFGLEPILMHPFIYEGISYNIDDPSEIGSDLVANAVYAFHQYKKNCVIVDFGTALTFTTVTATGKVLGVAIVPGLKTAIKALFSNTAQLPEVPLDFPKTAIGTDTVSAIGGDYFWLRRAREKYACSY